MAGVKLAPGILPEREKYFLRLFVEKQLMAVPDRRQSPSRSRKRRSHNALKEKQLQACPQCQTRVPSHVVCPTCGHYQGRPLVVTEE